MSSTSPNDNLPQTDQTPLRGSTMRHNILRLPAVRAVTGLSRSTVYNRISEGSFPVPISLGGRAVGWLESEIQRWLEDRIQESRKTATRW